MNRLQHFLHWRHEIPHMQVEQIDVIRVQALQTVLDGAQHALA